MSKQLYRHWNGWAPLFGFLIAFRPAVENTALKIDIGAANLPLQCSLGDNLRPTASVKRGQHEACDMPSRKVRPSALGVRHSKAVRRPDQSRRFGSRQPSFAGRALVWHYDADDPVVQAFLPMMIDRCPEHFQITTCGRVCRLRSRIIATLRAIDVCKSLVSEEVA